MTLLGVRIDSPYGLGAHVDVDGRKAFPIHHASTSPKRGYTSGSAAQLIHYSCPGDA